MTRAIQTTTTTKRNENHKTPVIIPFVVTSLNKTNKIHLYLIFHPYFFVFPPKIRRNLMWIFLKLLYQFLFYFIMKRLIPPSQNNVLIWFQGIWYLSFSKYWISFYLGTNQKFNICNFPNFHAAKNHQHLLSCKTWKHY